MFKILNLVIGGAIGTVSRYFVSGVIYKVLGTDFPYGTMAVNLFGCLILGFLASISEKKFFLGPNMRLLLMIGFCGAFTTFSTFMYETANLMKEGETVAAFVNVLISVIVGFIILRFGVYLGELI